MRANDKGFSRSVSFGNVISVGTGSMYVEPGKDLRRTKDRPPTPVVSNIIRNTWSDASMFDIMGSETEFD